MGKFGPYRDFICSSRGPCRRMDFSHRAMVSWEGEGGRRVEWLVVAGGGGMGVWVSKDDGVSERGGTVQTQPY